MTFMLMYVDIQRKRPFEVSAIRRALELSGTRTSALPYHGSQIAYDYEFGDDSTTVRVDDDPSSVVIDGGAPASFDIAWRMQQNYPEPIRLIDGQYSFDLLLNGFDSTAALTEAVEKEEWC